MHQAWYQLVLSIIGIQKHKITYYHYNFQPISTKVRQDTQYGIRNHELENKLYTTLRGSDNAVVDSKSMVEGTTLFLRRKLGSSASETPSFGHTIQCKQVFSVYMSSISYARDISV